MKSHEIWSWEQPSPISYLGRSRVGTCIMVWEQTGWNVIAFPARHAKTTGDRWSIPHTRTFDEAVAEAAAWAEWSISEWQVSHAPPPSPPEPDPVPPSAPKQEESGQGSPPPRKSLWAVLEGMVDGIGEAIDDFFSQVDDLFDIDDIFDD